MLPPLSELVFHPNAWQTRVVLDSWAGFRLMPDAYTPGGLDAVSDGSAVLEIETDDEETTLLPEQIAAYNYLREHEEAIQKVVLQHIFESYPELQEIYYDDDEERSMYMPNIERPDQLNMLIGLADVLVLHRVKNGIGYIGFNFRSAWDPEHGFSVTLHKERVVSTVGGPGEADFHAQRDAQT